MHQDEELHDQLMEAFRKYFKDTRFWLSEIRRLASERRMKIQEWRHNIDKHKAEKKKIQNQKAQDGDNNT